MENIVYFLTEQIPIELAVFFISMVPFIEVRGAIPIGVGLGIPPVEVLAITFLGSIIPIPFLIKFIRPLFNWLKKKNLLLKFVHKMEMKSDYKWEQIKKYEIFALFIFTALPLPGTGVWSASLMASLMNLRLKNVIPTIILGNGVTTILIAILSHMIIN
ncbi:COG2426 family protein [Peptoniphilus asaccharolyticus]